MPDLVPLELAAAASALHEYDGNAARVGRKLGMPQRTVYDIVHGYGRWAEVSTDSSFAALRLEQKRLLQAASARNMSKAMVQIEATLDKCSAPQAAMVYGILFDKDRLMAGESTQNVGVRTTNEVLNLDELAKSLSQELVKRRK